MEGRNLPYRIMCLKGLETQIIFSFHNRCSKSRMSLTGGNNTNGTFTMFGEKYNSPIKTYYEMLYVNWGTLPAGHFVNSPSSPKSRNMSICFGFSTQPKGNGHFLAQFKNWRMGKDIYIRKLLKNLFGWKLKLRLWSISDHLEVQHCEVLPIPLE